MMPAEISRAEHMVGHASRDAPLEAALSVGPAWVRRGRYRALRFMGVHRVGLMPWLIWRCVHRSGDETKDLLVCTTWYRDRWKATTMKPCLPLEPPA